jgi:gas vesicle protein
MCDSQSKAANAVSFSIGALVGAGAGFFLSTKKGRKYLKEAWRKVEPYLDDAVESAKDGFEEIKMKTEDKVEQTISQVKDFAEEKVPANIKKPTKRTFFKGV